MSVRPVLMETDLTSFRIYRKSCVWEHKEQEQNIRIKRVEGTKPIWPLLQILFSQMTELILRSLIKRMP